MLSMLGEPSIVGTQTASGLSGKPARVSLNRITLAIACSTAPKPRMGTEGLRAGEVGGFVAK